MKRKKVTDQMPVPGQPLPVRATERAAGERIAGDRSLKAPQESAPPASRSRGDAAGATPVAAQRSTVRLLEERVQTYRRMTREMAFLEHAAAPAENTGDQVVVRPPPGPAGTTLAGGAEAQWSQPQTHLATPALVLGALSGIGFALIASAFRLPPSWVCFAYLVPVGSGAVLSYVLQRRRRAARSPDATTSR